MSSVMDKTSALQDWGAPSRKQPGLVKPIAILAIVLVVMTAVFTFLIGPLSGIAIAVVGLAAVVLWLTSSGARFLKAWRAVPAAEDDGRLLNLVQGLASDLEVTRPKVWIVASDEPNAFAVWHRGANLGVTRALLDSFTRTETEAAVAHCLVRLRDERATTTYLAALAGLGLHSVEVDLHYADAKAVAVTRYPPALAAAIEKASPWPGVGTTLWLVGANPAAPHQVARAAALRDL